tara:strand:+ start:312 stop:488 length:177 start_codon:yes stop_codon:yes gene_type:complete
MIGLTGYEVMGQRTWPSGIDSIVYYGVYGCCGLFLFIAVVVVWKRLKKHCINRNIKKD